MDLDDILALATKHRPSPIELARARRVARAAQSEYDRAVAGGYEITVDADLVDPLAPGADEATRIARGAQLAQLGTITWINGESGRLSWSEEMATIFGRAPGTLQLSVDTLVRSIHPEDQQTVREAVEAAWTQRTPGEVTFRVIQPAGNVRHVRCDVEILTERDEPTGIIATGEDVTALELARRERRRLATRNEMLGEDLATQDSLTGLPTRGYLADEVDRARRTAGGALIVVATEPATRLPKTLTDQDQDRLTADVAELLRSTVEPGMTAGSVGPGLWGVLIPLLPGEAFALRIVDMLRNELFGVREELVRLNAWAGVVRFAGGDSTMGVDLLIDGEHAAGAARRANTAVHIVEGPVGIDQRTRQSRALVREAVRAGRFSLFAQPIADLGLNQVTRHEILLRVVNETGEPAAPWAFLDMAERAGEILTVDKWVIDHALKLIGRGTQTSHYQVNVSGRSLADPGLLDYVTEAISRHGVAPECLTFEITETALIENRNEALAFATGIRQIGCHLALDDFGTGYGALASLKYLPVDLVKIDGAFIVDLCQSAPDRALVAGLVDLCHTLGIRVAAEYVQDDATVALLRSYGVDFAQGYRIGRPQPIRASMMPEGPTIELELQHSADELELRRAPIELDRWRPQRRTAMG